MGFIEFFLLFSFKPLKVLQEIRIRGKKVVGGVSSTVPQTDTYDEQQIVQSGLVFTRRDEVIYNGEVVVTLVPDAEFPAEVYGPPNSVDPYDEVNASTNKVEGKRPAEGIADSAFPASGTKVNKLVALASGLLLNTFTLPPK